MICRLEFIGCVQDIQRRSWKAMETLGCTEKDLENEKNKTEKLANVSF